MKTRIESKPWIKPGWNKKRDSNLTWGQVRQIIGKLATDEEMRSTWEQLTARDKWDLIHKYYTPPKQVDINQGVKVELIIHGLENKVKEIEGKIIDNDVLELKE